MNVFLKMTTTSYIKSNDFSKLEEPIAVIFAFICRKFVPKRWEIVQELVKEQLCLDKIKHLSIKFFFKQNFNFL